QVAAAPVDQRIDPDLQEAVAEDLGQSVAPPHQDRGYRPPDVELCLPAPGLSLRAPPPVDRRAADWLDANFADRRADFPNSFGVGCGILYLRPTGITPAQLDERNASSALFAGPGSRAFDQQRPRGVGSDVQSPVRFCPHTEV